MERCHPSSTETHTANDKDDRASTTNSTEQDAKLGWILIHKNLISHIQLSATLDTQSLCHRQIGELLIEQQLISEEQLQRALKEQHWRRNGYWII